MISILAGSILLAFSACGKEEAGNILSQTEEIVEEEPIAEEIQEEEPVEEEATAAEEPVEEENKLIEAEEPEFIPEDLLAYLEDALSKENCAELLKELVCDTTILDKEEVRTYLDGPDIAEYKDDWYGRKGRVAFAVDGDNDGIEDIYAMIWSKDENILIRGTEKHLFFLGQEDGTYVETSRSVTLSMEFDFIEWDGKYYLLETDSDYSARVINGLIVTCFEDGKIAERAVLQEKVTDYISSVIFAEKGYEDLARQWQEEGKDGFLEENNYSWDGYSWELPIGSAETELGEVPEELRDASKYGASWGAAYTADLNNDGKEECYGKMVTYPGDIYSPVELICHILLADNSKEVVEPDTYYELAMEGVPVLFWVEYVEETDKQIVCMLSCEGLYTNHLYGYLIEGEKVTTVFEVEYEGTIEMERRIMRGDFGDEPLD